jgi:hypothetical protein
MALSLSESRELEELKQKHKLECYKCQQETMGLEHKQKMERLDKHLELAKQNYNFGGNSNE